jgi:hypothetical protein
MSWTQQVFVYCERGTSPLFWAEPLNAATNLAFLAAALAGFLAWRRLPAHERRLGEAALIALTLAIAIGSFLFHTTATRWAALADTLPIGLFMAGYLAYALRRFLGLGGLLTFAALAGFLVLLGLASMTRCGGGPCLNGSLAYLPALAVLALVGAILHRRGHGAGPALLAAAAIFAVSLTLRTYDRTLCPITQLAGGRPLGTHALWHLLNAIVIHLLLQAALRTRALPLRAAPPEARS